MLPIIIILLVIFSVVLLKRNCPVWNFTRKNRSKKKDGAILDVRAYNEPQLLKEDMIQIPSAYLQRYYHEIPDVKLHVIASNRMQLNHSIRFLLRKRFNIASYEVID